MSDWKREALLFAEEGTLSWRQISLILGVPKSTMSDFLRGALSIYKDQGFVGPKLLFLDIETAPLKAFLWSMWQNGVGLNQIQNDWFILSFCAKWGHKDKVEYMDLRGKVDKEDDSSLLTRIWELLNEADFVVTQNGRKFDIKKINARLIMKGFTKPSTFRQIDTLEIAKRQFGFTSRKLEYMTEKLCKTHVKSKHQKYPGQELWNACMKDIPDAWEEMEDYNRGDVLSLEELFHVFLPWDDKLPNFDLYYNDVFDLKDWEEDGFHYTNLGKYQRYRNKKTGQQRRGRVNLLPKEKRASLLANILV